MNLNVDLEDENYEQRDFGDEIDIESSDDSEASLNANTDNKDEVDDDNDEWDEHSNYIENEESGNEEDSSSGEDDDSSSSENDNDGDDDENNKILYPGSPLTVAQSMIIILSLLIRFQLTGSCLASILEVIAMHCIQPNLCKKTLYFFKKFFRNIGAPLIRHYYCSTCLKKLPTHLSKCTHCKKFKGINYLIEIPLLVQLQILFKRPGFFASLRHRFTRKKQNEENLEDIYDGNVYKELSKEGNILSDVNNISLTWNTDGVPLFKSSKTSIWPFYFTINELPFSERIKKENMILAGLWFGPSKPAPNLFLQFLQESLEKLYNGVNFKIYGNPNLVKVRGIVICGTCDSPARSLFLNMKQFNGKHGCQKCKIETKRLRKNVRIYPHKDELQLRTSSETEKFAQQAVKKKKAVFGVKGPTVISKITHDFIRTTSLDAMHCVFLGVVKRLLFLWFHSKHHEKSWSLSKLLDVVDKRITSLSPPSFVKRLTRKISDYKYWKAAELKLWLLYYSLPILTDILPEPYLSHHKLLVGAIYLLSQKSISKEMVNDADRALKEYVSRFQVLYGLDHMTSNVHSLRHLAAGVLDFGPLWVTSCFAFENMNGILKNMVHGTKYAELQICSAANMLMSHAELKSKFLPIDSLAYQFCKKIEKSGTHRLKAKFVLEKIAIIGKCNKFTESFETFRNCITSFGLNIDSKLSVFYKLLNNEIIYSSELYDEKYSTTSCCVKYQYNGIMNIGIIKCFLRVSTCLCGKNCNMCYNNCKLYAIVTKCKTTNNCIAPLKDIYLSFIHKFTNSQNEEYTLINVNDLITVCFKVVISGKPNVVYAIEPATLTEYE